MCGAGDFSAGMAQALQRIEADGIGGQQVGEVDTNRPGRAGAGAA